MNITQSDFEGRLKNAMRLKNDPIWQLAFELYDMGLTEKELIGLCNKAGLIPNPVKNRLSNFFRDIERAI